MRNKLPRGKLAIIGDVHGELEALLALLGHLGVDIDKCTSPRKLVFLGDLVDRGPDSPGVVALVRRLVDAGLAQVVLGNHELNLLRDEKKAGNWWFHGQPDPRYASRLLTDASERQEIVTFFDSLPLALERHDLLVVHACPEPLAEVTDGNPGQLYADAEFAILAGYDEVALARARSGEKRLKAMKTPEPMDEELSASADLDVAKQMRNPVKVVTSGTEAPAGKVFQDAGDQCRVVRRTRWWDAWADKPTIVGHYWREKVRQPNDELFAGIEPFAWSNNMFCVDYSVGKRYKARAAGLEPNRDYGLAAMLWPEKTLMFDDGDKQATTGFDAAARSEEMHEGGGPYDAYISDEDDAILNKIWDKRGKAERRKKAAEGNAKARAALYGHLAGDALGVPYEFTKPHALPADITWTGHGSHDQPPGTWSDDGALMLATAASLGEKRGFDSEDVGQRFVRWRDAGEMAAGGKVFDVGGATDAAIDRLRDGTRAVDAGGRGEYNNGNGSLMRILPVSLWTALDSVAVQIDRAHEASRITHGHARSQVCCAVHSVLVGLLAQGVSRQDALDRAFELVAAEYARRDDATHAMELAAIRSFDLRSGSGYVVDCLLSAWSAVRDADDYVDAVTRAVRYGNDTDTTAAVAGGLAGLVFGAGAVPNDWHSSLRLDPEHIHVIEQFVAALPLPG